jgi:hypothetical protein
MINNFSIDDIFKIDPLNEKPISNQDYVEDKRYFISKYLSSAKYQEPINYFIFKDDYKNFRSNVISSVHPVINSTRLNLGQGFYGRNFVGLNYINLNENNTDSTGEVLWHEQIHSSNPNLSEKEVRDTIRIRYDFTEYH